MIRFSILTLAAFASTSALLLYVDAAAAMV
jgi:hypothetical protein